VTLAAPLNADYRPHDLLWLQDASALVFSAPQPLWATPAWLALAPGLCLTAVVYATNVFGDALRDLLDPRMRGTR